MFYIEGITYARHRDKKASAPHLKSNTDLKKFEKRTEKIMPEKQQKLETSGINYMELQIEGVY